MNIKISKIIYYLKKRLDFFLKKKKFFEHLNVLWHIFFVSGVFQNFQFILAFTKDGKGAIPKQIFGDFFLNLSIWTFKLLFRRITENTSHCLYTLTYIIYIFRWILYNWHCATISKSNKLVQIRMPVWIQVAGECLISPLWSKGVCLVSFDFDRGCQHLPLNRPWVSLSKDKIYLFCINKQY